jgi:very-short-patch-repair endonuclease
MKRNTRLVSLARRQGGVITWREAADEGATRRLMDDLVQTGMFRRQYRGVYVLAGTPYDHATQVRCALAAVGAGAVASHASSAWLQGLLETPPDQPEVTALGCHTTRREGIRLHFSPVGIPTHRYRGIPCSTPIRTLVDLAASVSGPVLDAAVDKALSLGLVRLQDLRLPANRGRCGEARLRCAVERRGLLGGPSPSVLESRMSRLLKRSGLDCLKAEVIAGPDGRYRIDYACGALKLAIESYGYAWHHTPEQLARDLERQASLIGDGWTVLAYTWVQIERDSKRVATEIAATHSRLAALINSA